MQYSLLGQHFQVFFQILPIYFSRLLHSNYSKLLIWFIGFSVAFLTKPCNCWFFSWIFLSFFCCAILLFCTWICCYHRFSIHISNSMLWLLTLQLVFENIHFLLLFSKLCFKLSCSVLQNSSLLYFTSYKKCLYILFYLGILLKLRSVAFWRIT